MSSEPVRFLQAGLGPIGLDVIRRSLDYPNLSLAGAVDIRPDLEGKPLRSLVDDPRLSGDVRISRDLGRAIRESGARVVLLTTVSGLGDVVPDLVRCAEAGASVVSSCEELVYPFLKAPAAAEAIDGAARRGGTAVLGAGVNPGFVLDALPLVLSAPVASVNSVKLSRVVDAARRRGPLQKKVGAGLSPEEFFRRVEAGGFGHRGLLESVHMLCAGLGFDPAGATETIEPVISAKEVRTDFVHVRPGQVAGIHQEASTKDGRVHVDLRMYVGAPDPADRVQLFGTPDLSVTVEGGYPGDVATSAILLNLAPVVTALEPGLRTMLDVPLPRCRSRV